LQVRFRDFLAALATPIYVCYALRPVIADVNFAGRDRPELAGSRRLRGSPDRPAVWHDSVQRRDAACMLHDPARHEPLLSIAWDEGQARATIEHIVHDTEARFSAGTAMYSYTLRPTPACGDFLAH
jgi:hypothetical protein